MRSTHATGAAVLVVGSPRDPTIVHTVEAFARQELDVTVLDLDRFCLAGTVEGRLDRPDSLVVRDGRRVVRLGDFDSCYARFIDARFDDEDDHGAYWSRYRALQLAIGALATLVVNRPDAGDSNGSKPLQSALLARHGVRVPRGCSTNITGVALDFIGGCRNGAIYKSNSGERSIVHAVDDADLERLPLLARCPVFFQERIRGEDIRIHVVGERCFGVRIRSNEVDYRYDRSDDVVERPFDVPPALAAECVAVTRAFGLEFSGIDLIRSDDDGELYWLEVNPMPGYHGYDLTLDLAISRALGEALSARRRAG